MKLVVNKCFGGFSLSHKAVERMAEIGGRKCYWYVSDLGGDVLRPAKPGDRKWMMFAFDVPDFHLLYVPASNEEKNKLWRMHHIDNSPEDRSDPALVQTVEELGREAFGEYAELAVIEIPDGVQYFIDEYDGIETVREKHRSW